MSDTLFPNVQSERACGYARVAVERGIDRYPEGLTYAVPDSMSDLRPGTRVDVPLGRGDRTASGYVVEIATAVDLDPSRIKPIASRDETSMLPESLVALARWMSGYYIAPIGMTLMSMLPAAVKKDIGRVARSVVDLGAPVPEDVKLPKGQRAALEALRAATDRPVEMRDLASRAELKTTGPIKRLAEHGYITLSARSQVEASWIAQSTETFIPDALTPAQAAVVDAIGRTLDDGFSTHLLRGVTGSGKTEVYIRLIERVVRAGRVALMLVPEIALTPQTGGRLIGRFPNDRVAVLHSGLTAAQRHQQWAMVADGTARIVLGARSAVFAPCADTDLGLIIVDEEHDGSYKQDQVPRYHGRDVAVRRGQLAACPVVLGSATPSLETWYNATERGTYRLHELTERVPGMQLPSVHVVDFAAERRARNSRRQHLIGPTLEAALGRALDAGDQALLFLNRRGYANYISCPDQMCGWVMTCDDCDVTMVYHKDRQIPAGGYVQCHHCQSAQRLPKLCPECDKRVTTFGLGTQRVEEELAGLFPDLIPGETMLRVDSDTMHGSRDFHAALNRFGRGEVRLMVGTQMIAKGLDFPRVRVVGVINADTSINLPDFRAAERTFQLVSQVTGRCGRAAGSGGLGTAIVQSFNPGAAAIQRAAAHDYVGFAQQELADRVACGLPPVRRMARLIVRHESFERCVELARELATAMSARADGDIVVRGPAPCPISRIAGRHRQQVELLAPDVRRLQALLTGARNDRVIEPGAILAVDVDPIALL